jgi:predicted DNA-binding transcriptional regulator YafY
MTRMEKAQRAVEVGAPLAFDYVPKGRGRYTAQHRVVNPYEVKATKDGGVVVMAEDYQRREGAVRSFRLDRMFNVEMEV